MAEIPPLFSAPLDGILPHNAMGDFLLKTKKNSAANSGCQIQTLCLFWFITISGTTLPFRWARQWLREIPCNKLFIAAVSTRQGVLLGVLVFLPSLSEMVRAELPDTYIGLLVLPIQILPNSPSSLMENCWAFF